MLQPMSEEIPNGSSGSDEEIRQRFVIAFSSGSSSVDCQVYGIKECDRRVDEG